MYSIILNPMAGKGKSLSALETVRDILNEREIPYEIYATEYAGHAVDLARQLTEENFPRKLILMGGDGTFNEVLNGIVFFENITVGVIPCGTGNDFARAADIPTDPKAALEIILKDTPSYIDYIDAGERRALNCAGAGMDVDVLVRYSTMKAFRGKAKYYASLIDTLIHLRFHKVRLTLDGKMREESVFMVAATNGTCIGGGMPLSPRSDVADSYLNVVLIHELPKKNIPGALMKFLKGKHITEPFTEEFLVKEAVIEMLDDGKTEVDGEVFDNKILTCKVVSDTLLFYR